MPDKDFNTDYTKANAYMAEKCGVRILKNGKDTNGWICDAEQKADIGTEWTITDPRCREIIREHYKIETELSRGFFVGWLASEKEIKPKEGEPYKIYEGKTIAEAEIACILAISQLTITSS